LALGDKNCHLFPTEIEGMEKEFIPDIGELGKPRGIGIENAINYCKVQ